MSSAERYVPEYTVEDYRHWQGDWQLIDGVAIAMSPSPFGPHERAVTEFVSEFNSQLKTQNCGCRVYAGLDWVVNQQTVVRPDVMIVCDPQPDHHLENPPVIAVEILSPSTRVMDQTIKRRIYTQHGVQYYLIVDINAQQIDVVQKEVGNVIRGEERATLALPDGCEIELSVESLLR